MQQERSDAHAKAKRWLFGGGKVLCAVVIAGAVFLAGVGIGNGTIKFGTAQNAQNKDLPADLDYASVEKVYDALRANYDGDLDVEKLLDGLRTGLAEASGDPYTIYMNAQAADEFNKQLSGTFSGIGAELGKDPAGNLIIVSPISGFPAAKAGLRPQDVLVSIDETSAAGLNIEEAVTKIRGPKGTQVKIRVVRDKKEDLSFTITREDIKIPSVKYEILPDNVGYLQITQFNDDTYQLSRAAAEAFKKQGVKRVVLDLRGNPGGLLKSAVEVTSLWLPRGETILQERRGDLIISTSVATGDDLLKGIPTAVLIDAGSASASEIMAGALRDNKAATLFGVKSYGKGSVQQIQQLPGGGELKVTVARWFRPNGQNIDGKGIEPDTEVKMTEEDFKANRDPQKDAAINFIKS